MLTTFNSPFDAGLAEASGNITTDSTGDLTGFYSYLIDFNVVSDFTTNSGATSFNWNVRGSNRFFYSSLGNLTSSSTDNNVASNWTLVSVPEPSTYGAFAGLGALALAFARRRRG
jgi:hypothetical protein